MVNNIYSSSTGQECSSKLTNYSISHPLVTILPEDPMPFSDLVGQAHN